MPHYFAYGSNMCLEQMQNRCPGAQVLGVAHLKNHRLCFPQVSPKRQNAGVASIKADAGAVVEGVVYSISTEHLRQLDFYEDLGWLYDRHALDVQRTVDGQSCRCWTYQARADHALHFPPSMHYIDTILHAAASHGLTQAYQNMLRSFKDGGAA